MENDHPTYLRLDGENPSVASHTEVQLENLGYSVFLTNERMAEIAIHE